MAVLAALLVWATAADADESEPKPSVADLPIPGGDIQRVWYRAPENPVAALVLFSGSDGVLIIDKEGGIKRRGNFLIRTRTDWIARGFAVAIPDVPGDRSNLMNSRSSRSYGEILRLIVAFVRSRTDRPIWLVGTSAGSVAAAVAAGRMTQGAIAGLVLTSSVSRPGRNVSETVFNADLGLITVPTLVVSHEGDRCLYSPPSDASRIRGALTKAPAADVILVTGGLPPLTDECEYRAEHSYFGIEPKVLDLIGDWIKAHTP